MRQRDVATPDSEQPHVKDGALVPRPTARWAILNFIRWVGFTFVIAVAAGLAVQFTMRGWPYHSWISQILGLGFGLIIPSIAVIATAVIIESKKAYRGKPGRCDYCGHRLTPRKPAHCRVCGATQLGYCQTCRYDLRGTESGRCPECGTQNAIRKK